jgi:Conjugative transposon protein TcpC
LKGKLDRVRGTVSGGPLRSVGRMALWAVVVLLLVHGAVSLVQTEPRNDEVALSGSAAGDGSEAVDAFAVGFVRAYLADPSPEALAAFVVSDTTIASGGEAAPADEQVAQAEVMATRQTGGGRAVVTVWCELLTGRVVYLAVPTIRSMAGGVAALGPPAFVSAPGIGRVESDTEGSQPIRGVDAGEIRELAERFTNSYLSATEPGGLKYLTPPGSAIAPLGGFAPVGAVSVREAGDGGGPHRSVTVAVRARAQGGGVYPVAYMLALEKRDRWYVTAVEGEAR